MSTSSLSLLAGRVRRFMIQTLGAAGAAAISDTEAEQEFNALAVSLSRQQCASNPAYRRLCEARRRDPTRVGHWTEIPAAPTVAFKEFDLTCLAPAERTAVFHSSGTTGQMPGSHHHGAESFALSWGF